MTLRTERIPTLDAIRAFLDRARVGGDHPHHREATYAFVERTLAQVPLPCGPVEGGEGSGQGVPRSAKVTGYSEAQLTRMIAQQRRMGRIRGHRKRPPARRSRRCTLPVTPVLPTEVNEAFGQFSGPATKRILWCHRHVFGDARFERVAAISNGHIYNLRARRAYRSAHTAFWTTRGRPVADRPAAQAPPAGLAGRPPLATNGLRL